MSSEAEPRIRAFIAMHLTDSARAALVARGKHLAADGRRRLRLVAPEQVHLTLKFLGNVTKKQLSALTTDIEQIAQATAPIETAFGELTAFPSPARARVVAATLLDPDQAIAGLASVLDEAAARTGVPPEQRPFRPHVTLARLKRPGRIRWLEPEAIESEALVLSRVTLFRSDMRSSGAQHTPIFTTSLAGSGGPGASGNE